MRYRTRTSGEVPTCRSPTAPPSLRDEGWDVATWFVVGFGVLLALAAIVTAIMGSTLDDRAPPPPSSGTFTRSS